MIPIIDDDLSEPDERFQIVLTSMNDNCEVTSSPIPVCIMDNDGNLYKHMTLIGMCLMHACMCSTVANVSTDQTSYTVDESVGQLKVWINVTARQIAPGQECQILVVTTAGTAVGELKNTLHLLRPCMIVMLHVSLYPQMTILHFQKL